MKKLFAGITSFITLTSMCLPFSVSATEYNDKAVNQEKALSGYIDVVYPEQTCLLGDTSKIDSIWLKLVVLDDESKTVTLREFNTKYDKHSCYTVDTSSVDVSTPGTYQYSVKSLAGITETFSVPNEKGDYEYYDVEMTDYEATASLIVGNKERVLSLGVDKLTLEVGNTYNIEVYGYKSDELSFEWTDDKIASVDMWLENEAASNYRITADSEGETVLTFTAADNQTASIDISVVAEDSLPKTTTAVWYKDPETTTTTAVTNELYFNSQYGYVPVEIGLNSGISLAGYDDEKFYEIGESPIEFTIDDEQIAKVSVVQGVGVNVLGVSVGETMLHAKAPDGRTASIKVVVKEAPSTSTTAVWNDATTTTTTTVANELYFNSQYGYVPVEIGLNSGISLAGYDDGKIYEVGDSPIEFTVDDEKIAKVGIVQGMSVNVLGVSVGETVLNAKAPDGRTASIKVVVKEAPSTSTTAVWNDATTTTTTTVANELYFNSQYGYVPVEIGLNSGISLVGYDDGKFYEVGDSPIEFTVDDEQVAKVSVVQGISVNVLGVSVGETLLHAKAPDGRTASIKVVVKEAPSTSTTAVWNEDTTTTTTTVDTNSNTSGDPQLPQTGYSDIYKVIAGLAALLTVSGAALVVKTRKENE